MLDLKKMELGDLEAIKPYLEDRASRSCDYTVADMLMWREWFDKYWTIVDGSLVVHMKAYDQGPTYMLPLGGSEESRHNALKEIIETSRAKEETLRFMAVTDADLKWLQTMNEEGVLPGTLESETSPDWWDYVYTAEDLVTLSGRKYSTQRNHINKFNRDYPMYTFEQINDSNKVALQNFYDKYEDEFQKDQPILAEERIRIREILENMDLYQPRTGCLKLGEYVVGFAIGEVLGDTLFTHVEKASADIPGTYPMLTQQFNAYVTEKHPEVAYINREEDMGDLGLRQAKEAYNPVFMVKKYLVTVRA